MKTKTLISLAVTAKLICVFVFAYAQSRFSHNEAQLVFIFNNIRRAYFSHTNIFISKANPLQHLTIHIYSFISARPITFTHVKQYIYVQYNSMSQHNYIGKYLYCRVESCSLLYIFFPNKLHVFKENLEIYVPAPQCNFRESHFFP